VVPGLLKSIRIEQPSENIMSEISELSLKPSFENLAGARQKMQFAKSPCGGHGKRLNSKPQRMRARA
jgi:hypothetical protein